ncbi:MAG: MBL fold metallo-hydrolase, partial [Chitinophagales bacterium]|nr:MBL fold metallo-hydrolase [Chitinophagales bacterium]
MKVTFLGTGTSAGVPLIGCKCDVCASADPRDNRLRCSLFIECDSMKLLIDIGPDFRQQMLRENISSLDAVLITHAHRDHVGGLDDIRALNFTMRKPIDIYCDEVSEKGIKDLHPYVFSDTKYPYLPQIRFHRITDKPFSVGNLEIIPVEVMHADMPVKGFRIGKFAYITDCKFISESELRKLEELDTLVLSALRDEPHYSHLTFSEAIALARKINPQRTYFIHMSHQAGKHED